jgi:hypothetical protein
MGKTYEVELDGKVRRLAFHQKDAIALKKRFGRTPHELVFKDVLGLDFATAKPGEPARVNPGNYDPEVQFAVLHLALLRGGWNVVEGKVIDIVNDAVQAGKVQAGDFFAKAAECALYSGAVTGSQVDLNKEPDEAETPPAVPEGEAPASA